MKYELAKKLKDAGFPQKFIFPNDLELKARVAMARDEDIVTYPNLPELIEACEPQKADDFNLYTNLGQWTAHIIYHGHFEGWKGIPRDEQGFVSIDMGCSGSTPEEAVANLWLELNSKNV